jgi:hypothetical protein
MSGIEAILRKNGMLVDKNPYNNINNYNNYYIIGYPSTSSSTSSYTSSSNQNSSSSGIQISKVSDLPNKYPNNLG